jgi:pimeloyl-ACP methyl ester carboxylesterase
MRSPEETTTKRVSSADGTVIAYEKLGEGPALVLIDAAGHYRRFSSFTGLIRLLATDFTVYHYDRRGRGDSTDTTPYGVQREIEDLAALIDEAGESVLLYAFSSGGLLALQAAAAGLPIRAMALLEPPIERNEDRSAQRSFTADLKELVAARRPEAAVEYYLLGIGVPDDIVADMRETPSWDAIAAVAPTLVHDSELSEATTLQTLASVAVPTLVLDSEGSTETLTGMAATVAGAMPHAEHRSLAGEWHGVPDDVLAPALAEFFSGMG